MLAVGVFILPWFGFAALDVLAQPASILAVGLAASLAATGFGMLIGSLVRTPEQANVIGPFIIVIAAAIGGIFVPAYLLPAAFKTIANFSPMQWALQAFLDIFVRNANILQLLPNIEKLLGFAVLTISLAALVLSKERNNCSF
jgi:ABC-2 type transport system permease protein